MTEITTEKARIGAPSAQPFIDGFTEEGENLSPVNTGTNTSSTSEKTSEQAPSAGPLAGARPRATPTAAALEFRTVRAQVD
ncbi:protein involved in iron-sulfur cluster assembly [Arthrobacter sp. Hiyo1]|nr:protein involved in iron-sulfur cluster assembly [Arthrobacter sp. Hiyo1]